MNSQEEHENIYILTGLGEDDCLTVICHWHYKPTQREIADMIVTTSGTYVAFVISTQTQYLEVERDGVY